MDSSYFKHYASIANDNNDRTINYYREQGLTTKTNWYATEKVHGTNFSFISDGNTVIHAQRSGITEGSFMNHLQFCSEMDNNVLSLAKHLGEPVQVVTEYYGKGIISKAAIPYRNDDVKAFVAYDVYLPNKGIYMSYPDNFDLLHKFDIPTTAVIAEGTFEDLLKIDTHYRSILAKENGVETYAEGVVLKPFEDLRLETGDRVILKRVSTTFAENRPQKVEKTAIVVDDNVIAIVDSMNTEVRLGKVAAKYGIVPSEKGKFGLLITEFAKDIAEEANLDVNTVKKQVTSTVKSFFAM